MATYVHVLGFPEPIAISSLVEGQIKAQLNDPRGDPSIDFRDEDGTRYAVRPSAVMGFSYHTR